ncbi:MAG: hypothetical protein IAF38_19820 [Bacteroidia bacterium]|nr:hypothetical protein [Bacteroidia bacterium]
MRQEYVAVQFPSLKNAEGVFCPQKNPGTYPVKRIKVSKQNSQNQNQAQGIVLKTPDKDSTKKDPVGVLNEIADQKQN